MIQGEDTTLQEEIAFATREQDAGIRPQADPFAQEEGGEQVASLGSTFARIVGKQKMRRPRSMDMPPPDDPIQPLTPQAAPEPPPERVRPEPIEPPISTPEQAEEISAGMGGEMPPVRPTSQEGGRSFNADLVQDERVQEVLLRSDAAHDSHRADPRRQYQSHEETIAKAEAAEPAAVQRVADYVNGQIDTKLQPEDIVVMGGILETQAADLDRLARQVKAQRDAEMSPSSELLSELHVASQKVALTMSALEGAKSEAARVLNASQAVKKRGGGDVYREMAETVSVGGGRDELIEKALRVVEASDRGGTGNKIKDIAEANRPRFLTKAKNTMLTWRYNMMLSSVRSHMANIFGAGGVGLWEAGVIKPIATSVNNMEALGRKVLGLKPTERMYWSEIPVGMKGAVSGVKDGITLVSKILRGEETGSPLVKGKIRNERGELIDDQFTVPGLSGVINAPTRALEAEDAMVKSIVYNAEMRGLVHREVVSMFGDSNSTEARAAFETMMATPPEHIHEAALARAEKITFTNQPNVYGKILAGFADIAINMRDTFTTMQIMIPFVRTPANIVSYAAETTGLQQVLSPFTTLQKLKGTGPERAEAAARIAAAFGLFTILEEWYDDGKITGMGPSNFHEQSLRRNAGISAGTYVGDDGKTYQLNRMDPWGLTLLAYATYRDRQDELKGTAGQADVALGTLLGVADLIQDRGYLSGLSDVMGILDGGSPTMVQNAVAGVASSFIIPNVSRDVRMLTDDYQRDLSVQKGVASIGDRIMKVFQNAIPLQSQNLPPRVDVNGNYVKYQGDRYVRAFLPVPVGEYRGDKVTAAYLANQSAVSKPSYEIALPKHDVKINLLAMDDNAGWVYHQYQRKVGKVRHALMKEFIDSGDYANMFEEGGDGPESELANQIRTITTQGLRLAQLEFIDWLDSQDDITPYVDGKPVGEAIPMQHMFTKDEYMRLQEIISLEVERSSTPEFMKMVRDKGIYTYRRKNTTELLPEGAKSQIEEISMPRF